MSRLSWKRSLFVGLGVTVATPAFAEEPSADARPPVAIEVAPPTSDGPPMSPVVTRAPVETPVVPAAAAEPVPPKDAPHHGRFVFGSYGRIVAASDGTGRPARVSNFVAHGSRIDAPNYVELELRREDHWDAADIDTRIVSTLAVGNSIFHYDGVFDAALAVRNLYLEASDLGTKGFSAWAGSRMYRGDDIYLLNYWPLDNLNTLGAGIKYQAPTRTTAQLHMGFGQPQNPFYRQEAKRASPLNQFGAATVALLDRQRWVGSARVEQTVPLRGSAGLKVVGYGEAHRLPAGQRETAEATVYQDVSAETGFVVGAQLGAWTGERNTHANLFVRYARGIAAYGDFANPDGLGPDQSTRGAHELSAAFGGNWEWQRLAVMGAAYVRSFRNASPSLDAGDVDEGIVMVRPQYWFLDWLGLGIEGSYQVQERGVLVGSATSAQPKPLVAHMPRVGILPFISPAGRGSFSRPMLWLLYTAGYRDVGARALYPTDDVFHTRSFEQFIGAGAEWWFGSSSYGGGL